jgi:hypothetical protein
MQAQPTSPLKGRHTQKMGEILYDSEYPIREFEQHHLICTFSLPILGWGLKGEDPTSTQNKPRGHHKRNHVSDGQAKPFV